MGTSRISRQHYLHNLASLKLALDVQRQLRRSKALIDEASHLMATATPTVTIRRDPRLHKWVQTGDVTEKPETPWSDETEAPVVVSWLKARAMGRLNVKVDLN